MPAAENRAAGKADLLLAVTRRCNLACPYCFEDRSRKPADLPPATLKAALALLFASSGRELSLQIFGGEPALAPGTVRRAVTAARALEASTGRPLRLSLTTNLLGWSPAALRFLAARRVTMLASLDGDEQAQALRCGSQPVRPAFARMLAAARLFRSLGGTLRLNMVVPPAAAGRLRANYLFLKSLGLGGVQAAYAIAPGWTAARRGVFLRQLRAAVADGLEQDFAVEPVLTHPQVYCDCSGTLSVGCAAVLETSAPELAAAFNAGPLKNFRSLDELKMSRGTQQAKVKRLLAAGAVPAFVGDCLALGAALSALTAPRRAR